MELLNYSSGKKPIISYDKTKTLWIKAHSESIRLVKYYQILNIPKK